MVRAEGGQGRACRKWRWSRGGGGGTGMEKVGVRTEGGKKEDGDG